MFNFFRFLLPALSGFLTLRFGGGGGGDGPTQTTTTTSNVPEYAQPYFERLLGQTEALTGPGNAYQPYTGLGAADYQVAGMTPYQTQAGAGIQSIAQAGAPAGLTAGQGAVSGALTGLQGYNYNPLSAAYQNIAAGQHGPQLSSANANTVGAFMSPYMQGVVDVEKREAVRQDEIARQGRQAQAVRAGAFGGSRQAVQEAEAQRNLGTQLGAIQARGLQDAYGQAQQALKDERGALMQAGTTNIQAALQAAQANQQAYQLAQQAQEQSRQFGATSGLQALQQRAAAGAQLGQMGLAEQEARMQAYGALGQLGAQQQALDQQKITNAYQQYLDRRNYPYKNLGFMSDILHGVQGTSAAQSMYQQPPGVAQQMAALGLGAYGLSSMFGKKARGGQIKLANQPKKGKINPNMGMGLAKLGLQRALQG